MIPILLFAAGWGFAEATVFFFVPDVLLTFVVFRHGTKTAFVAVVASVVGAVTGGVCMYLWGLNAGQQPLFILDYIPAIGPEMFTLAQTHLREDGVFGLFLGTANGIPYKIYAVLAPSAGIDLNTFTLMSFPARAYRFLIAVLLAGVVAYLTRGCSVKLRYSLLATFWVTSYAVYFYHYL